MSAAFEERTQTATGARSRPPLVAALVCGAMLCAGAADAQISFVGAGAQVASASAGSIAPALPAAGAAGDFAVLFIAGQPSDTSEPSAPSGWTLRSSILTHVSSTDLKLLTFYRVLAGGDANPAVTLPAGWVGANAGMSGQIAVWRGVDATTPFDAADTTGTSNPNAQFTAPAITTATANALVVSAVATSDDNDVGFGSNPGFVARMSSTSYDTTVGGDHSIAVGDTLQPTAGAVGMPVWQQNTNSPDRWAAITFALRPGGGGAKFTINHDGFGIHCLAETITVHVVDSIAGTPLLNYNAQVQLDTQTASGTWALVTGGGSFSDGAANDGVATYTWPLGESQAVFTLYYPSGPPSVDVDVFQVSDPGIRDTDAEGALVFAPNGFTVTAAALSNPPGVVTSFAANQVAGTDFALHLAAYGQTPGDPVCGIIESYTGAKSLKFWSTYANPATGVRAVTIDGVAAAVAEGAAAAQAVTFANGQAVVTAKYKDVGQIRVSMKDDTLVDAAQLPNGIRGATANFVVRPYDFLLTSIANAAGSVANPQANDAAGGVFVAAGAPFRATVTVRDAEGSVTPSYGREAIPETVRLVPQLHAPAGGALPAIGSTVGFGAFANGVATGSDFTWPEVGIVRLVPHVGDGDYLGGGDVAVATPSERVGRFVPSHFVAALNTPLFGTACGAGGFTYAGQPFVYTTPPQITVTATAVGGATTTNYTGAFFKLATSTLQNRVYTSPGGALDASALPSAAIDPMVAPAAPGVATLTFSSGAGLAFVKGAPQAPFSAGVRLSIDVLDADGVAAAGAAPLGNPVTFGSASGIDFSTGQEIRYGRIRVGTAIGSELVDLPVPVVAQHFSGAGAGFVANSADVCTSGVSVALSGYTSNLAAGETCARDGGAPGASGIGCPAPAPLAQRFTSPPLAGDFNLRLAAPGAGNNGSVLVTGAVPTWLRFDWNGAVPGDENPIGQATFGIYNGEQRQIYTREIY